MRAVTSRNDTGSRGKRNGATTEYVLRKRQKQKHAKLSRIFSATPRRKFFPPPSLPNGKAKKGTPTSRRLFPRGDELFLSVQTAQFRNYHHPYSNAIECKSAIRQLSDACNKKTRQIQTYIDTLSSDKLADNGFSVRIVSASDRL